MEGRQPLIKRFTGAYHGQNTYVYMSMERKNLFTRIIPVTAYTAFLYPRVRWQETIS